jgi:hypothetical protein
MLDPNSAQPIDILFIQKSKRHVDTDTHANRYPLSIATEPHIAPVHWLWQQHRLCRVGKSQH